MSQYHYLAKDSEGKETEGDREAKDRYDLARVLRTEGLMVLTVENAYAAKRSVKNLNDYMPNFLKWVSLEDKLNFTRNTAVMVGAGVPLSKALEVMSRQAKNQKFKEAILAIAESIKTGATFADSIAKFPSIFPKFYQEMVRSGEKSGKLEEALKLVGLQLKKDYTLRRKVKGAMVYPAVIVCAMILIGILMLIYVVPTLVQTFVELKVDLPWSTRLVIFVSRSLLRNGLILLAAFGALAFGAAKWLKSKQGANVMDWVFVHLPVIKGINQKFNAARACRTLSSLIASGVDILDAFKITEDVMQNHLFSKVLAEARESIQKGGKVAEVFQSASASVYPPLVGEMMAVGEETGKLDEMLLRLAVFYEGEVSAATKDISSIIEPVLMIIIGVVVGFFAISMISPMYSLVDSI
ncbi:type II secretion system F family protein [Candidatus Giovannonibacteria bacterium]|nr:type II secretion system F family protein [Candidatus Giovannonibacteria bacterium]